MKTALLHYWLTNRRGGENVFREIANLFPAADIYTHAYNPAVMCDWFEGHPIHETFIGRMLPFARTKCQIYLPLMFRAARQIDLSDYDLIISSESGPIKGINKPAHARHICYCHTPMRYLWDMYEEYYRTAGIGGKIAMKMFRHSLRRADLKSADSVDTFVANSKFVARRIRRIYKRESQVIYPMVNYKFFSSGEKVEKKDYYLLAGQLVSYKRPDIAIGACLRLGRKLVIVGSGPRVDELKRKVGSNDHIQFVGRVSDEELRRRYAEARALLFPGVEDFGIVPLEAMSAGTPVLALGVGGALETVVDGQTGLFFTAQTAGSLCSCIEEFESRTWNPTACQMRAAKFGPEHFRQAFRALVDGRERGWDGK